MVTKSTGLVLGVTIEKSSRRLVAYTLAFKLACNVVSERVGDFLDGLKLDNIKQKTLYLLGVSGVIQPVSSERSLMQRIQPNRFTVGPRTFLLAIAFLSFN